MTHQSILRHGRIDLVRPGQNAALQVLELGEAVLLEVRDGLGAAHAALAVHDHLAVLVELTQALLRRIAELDPKINAFLTVTEEDALSAARTAERSLRAGRKTRLLGIPLALQRELGERIE